MNVKLFLPVIVLVPRTVVLAENRVPKRGRVKTAQLAKGCIDIQCRYSSLRSAV